MKSAKESAWPQPERRIFAQIKCFARDRFHDAVHLAEDNVRKELRHLGEGGRGISAHGAIGREELHEDGQRAVGVVVDVELVEFDDPAVGNEEKAGQPHFAGRTGFTDFERGERGINLEFDLLTSIK
jgi:hypothetical protein